MRTIETTQTTQTETKETSIHIRIVAPDVQHQGFLAQLDAAQIKGAPDISALRYVWFFAEEQGRMVGCAALELQGEDNITATFRNLWIEPELRHTWVREEIREARQNYLLGYVSIGQRLEVIEAD